MTKTYHPLETITLNEDNSYTHAENLPELIHIDDYAKDIMIDFEHVKPITANQNDLIDTTLISMKSTGLHVLLVVENETVAGAVSSSDLQGEKPMRIIQEQRIPRKEILVKHVMTPCKCLLAVDYDSFKYAKIGDVIATLRKERQRYMLIVDTQDNKQNVHGLINIYDIINRLDRTLEAPLREARSVLELQQRMED